MPRRTTSLAAAAAVTAAAVAAFVAPAAAGKTCPAPAPMTFAEPKYVDTTRAGGEPIVATHPDGTILYGAHAGTTHFFTPSAGDPDTIAFPQGYRGQTYYWRSTTDGEEWEFIDRTVPPSNVPGTGFSDPEFAIDLAGNVYVSEINLVNVAMSKSGDSGKSYQMQNATAMTMTDRQWTEADEDGVVYMVGNASAGGTFPGDPVGNSGHVLYKSIDGGKTWTNAMDDGDGLGDLRVDKRNGTLYEAWYSGNILSIAAYRDARQQDFTEPVEPEVHEVASGVNMLAHWPSFDIDPEGNLYMTWDEKGNGDRPAGIYYTYSTDAGRTWAEPVRVDTGDNTSIWPWLAVGDKGRVAVAWFETDTELPAHDAETEGTHGWRIQAANSLTGLGCGPGTVPSFTVSDAFDEPLHTGTICQGGTTCQAFAIDRRLGDYFSIEIDGEGMMYAAYSDTRRGGAVSLPGFVRQNGGPSFLAPTGPQRPNPGNPPKEPAQPKPNKPEARPRNPLPTTGADAPILAVLVIAGALVIVRSRRARARARDAA